MSQLAWLLNPWDSAWAALIFVAVVVGLSIAMAELRQRLGAELAALLVAMGVTAVYVSGAIATSGVGPLIGIGIGLIFSPSILLAYGTMYVVERLRRGSR